MTPERMAALVAWWARFYTRDLPPPVAERRIAEIDADLHDHIAHERAHGTDDGRIALGVAARMVRGLPADLAWRSTRKDLTKMSKTAYLRVALVTAAILLPLGALQVAGQMNWGPGDFALAAALLVGTGLLLELAVSRPRSVVLRAGSAALGLLAIVLGEADDAPGLVLFGGLLILGTIVLTFRTAQRST